MNNNMTQQDKDLLLRDLCARLPYGVILKGETSIDGTINNIATLDAKLLAVDLSTGFITIKDESHNWPLRIGSFKPYLRPLSSMTQEERDKFCDIGGVISYRPTDGKQYIVAFVPEALDYLNSIHADYRGLIEKGLAIEVTDENNPYK